jgi:acyl-CoA thioester hydrolase
MKSIKKTYKFKIKVGPQDIDEFEHVNNEVYLTWLLKAAIAHSTELGYSMRKYMDDGAGFVVRRHEIDYLAPAFLNEELSVETWVSEMSGVKTTREYQLSRGRDEKIILTAKTLWIYVSLTTGKPTLIPPELLQVFLSTPE